VPESASFVHPLALAQSTPFLLVSFTKPSLHRLLFVTEAHVALQHVPESASFVHPVALAQSVPSLVASFTKPVLHMLLPAEAHLPV